LFDLSAPLCSNVAESSFTQVLLSPFHTLLLNPTVLQIDLKVDEYVYDMMKGNPKLDFEIVGDVETFQYRDKYKIK
jgi:hypothetical protein